MSGATAPGELQAQIVAALEKAGGVLALANVIARIPSRPSCVARSVRALWARGIVAVETGGGARLQASDLVFLAARD